MRLFLEMAAGHGFVAVALGAFGAHGLRNKMAALADGAQRLQWWETAAHYQLSHALALGLVGVLTRATPWHLTSLALKSSGICFTVGAAVFSGTLYAMTLTGVRWLGAITPIGGLLLLAGWACLLWAAISLGVG